jgi:hypothetical protein
LSVYWVLLHEPTYCTLPRASKVNVRIVLRAQFYRIKVRRGLKKAIMAVVASILLSAHAQGPHDFITSSAATTSKA